jgi:hypothetical protein
MRDGVGIVWLIRDGMADGVARGRSWRTGVATVNESNRI